ncbi:MAG: cation-translocating P-type ATPase [Candidatus Hodarchaeales archaeon]|jgi:Ca2+-transporting ATPase
MILVRIAKVIKIKPEISSSDIIGHEMTLDMLVAKLNTVIDIGLSSKEAENRLEIHGPNAIPKPKQSFWKVYLAPLMNTLIVIYLIMTTLILVLAILYLFINPDDKSIWITAIQWAIIVGVNFIIAIIQQARAHKKIDALHKLSAPSARVVRNDNAIEIATEELVPGDIIKIAQGDRIPADARIVRASNLYVDESSLTGESVPVNKVDIGEKALPTDTPLSERNNVVFKDSFVTMGSGSAVVVKTGKDTIQGSISLELEELNTGDIPIRAKVNTIGNYLTAGMLIIFSLLAVYQGVIIFSRLSEYENWIVFAGEIIFSLSTIIIKAMSVVPINIPLLTTIVLITGVLAMAKHNVIIRNLAAIESLGRISVLCTDKTGTITTGQMTVKRIWDTDNLYHVTGLGYAPNGKIIKISKESEFKDKDMVDKPPVSVTTESSLGTLLISGVLNNDSSINVETTPTGQKVYSGTGSPTDSALMSLFNKSGIDKKIVEKNYDLVTELPFDSSLKRMSKVFKQNTSPEHVVFCKGATEVILERCTSIGLANEKYKLTDDEKRRILDRAEDFASMGYRILSLTYKIMGELPPKGDKRREIVESDLSYLGFVCVLDPPRDKVDDSVDETLDAAITPIMITGDSLVTAESIARSVGIIEEKYQQVHEGNMASKLNDKDFLNTRVFARVSPKDKQIIVERYQEQNRVVAMTGDGVNDALALSMSDAGIAMGISGTEVSKQAADLVIADDSFNSIVTGIREGRGLFQRIRIIAFFFICVNLAEAAVYIGTSFFLQMNGMPFELLDNLQRAYIFSIAHLFPPLALIIDKIPADIMNRDPMDSAGIFNKRMVITLIMTSISITIVIYIIYFATFFGFIPLNPMNGSGFLPIFQDLDPTTFDALRPQNLAHAKARTMMHTILYVAIPLIVLSIRRIDKSIIKAIKEDSWWFTYLAISSVWFIHVGLMYIPMIQELAANFGIYVDIIALSVADWLFCIVTAIVPVLVLEGSKYYNRLRGKYF